MKVIVLGAGLLGVTSAYFLRQQGHEVVVVDRQASPAAETSFANGAQISVSYCEPWANKEAPLKALKWMLSKEAPLLFRPQNPFGPGLHQYTWGLQFLANCNDMAFERNVQQLVALGAYSHAALKDVVAATGIDYNRLERGIAHYYCDQKSFDTAGDAAALMRKYGVARRVVSTAELLKIEPALGAFADRIVGGTYTASDESGDARLFTQALARRWTESPTDYLAEPPKPGSKAKPGVSLVDAVRPDRCTPEGYWPTPTASNSNETETLTSWLARRERLKALAGG